MDDEDDDLEEEADEDDLNDDVQFEFFKDFTVSKPIPGTKFERERRILAFGNGNKQMTEEMTQFVNQLANISSAKTPFEHTQDTARRISEKRNKKRKELAQSIFDANPFSINNARNHMQYGDGVSQATTGDTTDIAARLEIRCAFWQYCCR